MAKPRSTDQIEPMTLGNMRLFHGQRGRGDAVRRPNWRGLGSCAYHAVPQKRVPLMIFPPPISAKFRYMNETWITIGWAKKSEDGDYVWCRSNDATFVIGARVGVQSNWIAPIGPYRRDFQHRQ